MLFEIHETKFEYEDRLGLFQTRVELDPIASYDDSPRLKQQLAAIVPGLLLCVFTAERWHGRRRAEASKLG